MLKPAGWLGKADDGKDYWLKSSTFGIKSKCRHCGLEAMGYGSADRHYKTCSKFGASIVAHEQAEILKKQRDILNDALRAWTQDLTSEQLHNLVEVAKAMSEGVSK